MNSYLEYLLFIGIIVCLWGAWWMRSNSVDGLNRRWSDKNYCKASWILLGAAGIGTLTLLITE